LHLTDVFDEEQDEDVVLVLRGVHAASQLIAGRPEGGVKFGFFDGHEGYLLIQAGEEVEGKACVNDE
jgi:hypothetical protein